MFTHTASLGTRNVQAWIFKIPSRFFRGKLDEHTSEDHLLLLPAVLWRHSLLTAPAAYICLLMNFRKHFTTLNCVAKLYNYTVKPKCSSRCHSSLSGRLRTRLAAHFAWHRSVEEDAKEDSIPQHVPSGCEWKRWKNKGHLNQWAVLTLSLAHAALSS